MHTIQPILSVNIKIIPSHHRVRNCFPGEATQCDDDVYLLPWLLSLNKTTDHGTVVTPSMSAILTHCCDSLTDEQAADVFINIHNGAPFGVHKSQSFPSLTPCVQRFTAGRMQAAHDGKMLAACFPSGAPA